MCAAVAAVLVLLVTAVAPAGAQPPADQGRPFLPILAYYYQWFDPPSWNRDKLDHPVLGDYSSDDIGVMRQHVRMAKAAGLNGFAVSWKSTPTNDARLRRLIDVAREEGFGLAINYESLDAQRDPLPADRVAADLRTFRDTFAADPVFQRFGRPLLIWSGTWAFSPGQVAAAVGPVRDAVQVLASEKDADGYRRLADLVAGDAYYWSSVDPTRDGQSGARLQQLGDAVHAQGGLWMAPFAPGFDARLIGGTRVVDRRDGATLRAEYSAAVASSPDMLGLISWNEFTENTYVEPSANLGHRYLDVLTEIQDSPAPAAGELAHDSSSPPPGGPGGGGPFLAAAGAGVLLTVIGVVVLLRRRNRPRSRHGVPPTLRPGVITVVLGVTVATGAALLAATVPQSPSGAAPVAAATPYYQGDQPARDDDRAVIAAAGDIACSPDPDGLGEEEAESPTSCVQQATADLVGAIDPDAVLTLGDNQYPDGSLRRFQAGFDHNWGRYKSIIHPAVGNHEYGTTGAGGYFAYFGQSAGAPDAGYYSFDLAGWHVVALNSECSRIGGCGAGSPQERWLRADLAAHPSDCSLAYLHRPRFSSGHHGDNVDTSVLWSDLRAAGAELALAGHDHDYERFAPMGPDGKADPEGVRQFVIGTGGDSFLALHAPRPGHEVGIAGRPGVLELVLRPGEYEWSFRSINATAPADFGSDRCHAAPH